MRAAAALTALLACIVSATTTEAAVAATGINIADLQHNRFGFPEEYMCHGAVFDEPAKFRMKCRRAPPRALQCVCNTKGKIAYQLACKCDEPLNAAGKKVQLLPPLGAIETLGLQEPE